MIILSLNLFTGLTITGEYILCCTLICSIFHVLKIILIYIFVPVITLCFNFQVNEYIEKVKLQVILDIL